MNSDMQYRSSAELVNKFKIKREQLEKEHNDKAKREHVSIAHKSKNFEGSIPQQGKSKLIGHKSVIQSSSREVINNSHMIAEKGQNNPRLFQSTELNQKNGVKFPMYNFRSQTPSKADFNAYHTIGIPPCEGEEQHDIQELQKRKLTLQATSVDQFLKKQGILKQNGIHELPNCKQVQRNLILLTSSIDQFLKNKGIHLCDETKRVNNAVDDVEFMHVPLIDEHNKELDDALDQEEIGEDDCSRDEEIDIDGSAKGILEKKNIRGQTTCKEIHARNLEEREEVTFDKGQAVRPTNKIVSDLTNFIRTVARNSRFISLMYTSWHAVLEDNKKRTWECQFQISNSSRRREVGDDWFS